MNTLSPIEFRVMVIVATIPNPSGVSVIAKYNSQVGNVNPATIYTTLARLVTSGHLTTKMNKEHPHAKIYSVTQIGLTSLSISAEHYKTLAEFGSKYAIV